ncbi:hypothetical protein CVT24_009413 [Panaeolus cyanescens]|uniref:Yippee domain-containing protein n=1 Tax=Panaeolus cyanescens TaxID=181874 RepID=A0A409VAQ2_9AGAR|nr:hypothetical protein CVT24_009413 [Panaeolus cyanescens]
MDNDSDVPSTSARRRLPAVPSSQSLQPPVESSQSKRSSRPLPKIPRALTCKKCGTCITSHNVLLPQSSIPPNSRSFRGFSGKASLFTETYNCKLAKPGVQLMATGAHTMQEITCGVCSTYLGWKILRAHESTETWKEGHCLLELEHLYIQEELHSSSSQSRSESGSDSDASCL